TNTLRVVTSLDSRGMTKPAGDQPGGGRRTIAAPTIMKHRYRSPRTAKVSATPIWVGGENWPISHTDRGEAINAPPPNPMIAMPVAMPGRSGNQRISVETGEM